MELSGKNVVYVGGLGGIGVATSKLLLAKNIKNLVFLDRVESPQIVAELSKLNPTAGVFSFKYDLLASVDEMTIVFQAILAKIQTIDILINGAGIFNDHLVEETIRINLTGVINTATVVFKLWDKRTGGSGGLIVNIASAAGVGPHAAIPVYSASKAGVIAFTKATSQLVELSGVSTYAICPGPTKTTMIQHINSYLDFVPNITELMHAMECQTADTLAANMLAAIEKHQNGAIWVMDAGQMLRLKDQNEWVAPEL